MIPTYNCATYLGATLRSVLGQDPGIERMQIEVVDDRSTQDDHEALVADVGKGRVAFFRQPRNVGISANFTTCIRRAKGNVVHILHGDDMVLPGFYSRLQEAFEKEPSAGAAFCRHIVTDEEGHWQSFSPLYRETPGILPQWLDRLAVKQLIQTPAIVVRRDTYEKLGGFHPELSHAADWEMWKRIAVRYPFWYEPTPLACYRMHSNSDSSQLMRSGGNAADTRRAINITRRYLPESIAEPLSRQALECCAAWALQTARRFIEKRDIVAACAQMWEAQRCWFSLGVARTVCQLLLWALWREVTGQGRSSQIG